MARLTNNPTKTRTIEKAWLRETRRRWREFKKQVTDELLRQQARALTINAEAIALDDSQLRAFMVFYQRKIEELLLGTSSPPNWQARYQLEAYQRGLRRVRASLRQQGATLIPTTEDIQVAQTFTPERLTATPSLVGDVGSAVSRPIHQASIEFLTTRSYTSLKGWTDALERETRQIISDSIVEGRGIDETVRAMGERIDVSRSRAQTIARTETVQAYQTSSISATQDASEELGEELMMRWITARDDRVRSLHAGWHGTVRTPEEMNRRKGISPYNCRCALVTVIPEAQTEATEERFTKQREQLLALEAEKSTPPPKKPKPATPTKKKAAPKKVEPKPRPTDFATADPVTKDFIEASINDPKYVNIVSRSAAPKNRTTAESVRMYGKKNGRGAYHIDGVIHMESLKTTTREGQAAYRHEFGHYVSHTNGKPTFTPEYDDLRKADEKHLAKGLREYYNDYKKRFPAPSGSKYPAFGYGRVKTLFNNDRIRELEQIPEFESSEEVFEWLKTQLPSGSMAYRIAQARKWEYPNASERIIKAARVAASALINQHKRGTPATWAETMRIVGYKATEEKYPETGFVSDLIGAITNEKIGHGHGKTYYKDRTYNIGGRDIRTGNNEEAFANIFALYADEAGELGTEFVREISPNLLGYLEGIL